MSSPTTNVLWGLANVAGGCVLLRSDRCDLDDERNVAALFGGATVCAVVCARWFRELH